MGIHELVKKEQELLEKGYFQIENTYYYVKETDVINILTGEHLVTLVTQKINGKTYYRNQLTYVDEQGKRKTISVRKYWLKKLAEEKSKGVD